jgi:hypothetical protein
MPKDDKDLGSINKKHIGGWMGSVHVDLTYKMMTNAQVSLRKHTFLPQACLSAAYRTVQNDLHKQFVSLKKYPLVAHIMHHHKTHGDQTHH